MTNLVLTKTKMRQGLWEGLLTGAAKDTDPKLDVTHQGVKVPDVNVSPTEAGDGFSVRIPIPSEVISDGMQTIVVADAATNETLASITLMAGEALGDDMRVEVDLLRAELDMLKRAFRRHCLETS
ncbi:hypothetical protein [Sulfitobacter guttiformis]|uniref:Uncharacterized protein n=1 Tax=Sulfitobacter guttiformis TaxID=74349 RepID=A0A420DSG6_9RHOB|nr:hypothetical protein [Sulfitobacter guttiformis]KIN74650.1 hypothetical protein Z949_3849 [Sulfitobacter guttiformis KCTC 32187]RKE97226.1 hypothetical protein C8N30_1821 [Sulfitobacter guttiformis]